MSGTGAPLSFAQQDLWLLQQLRPGSSELNVPVVLRLRGEIDPALLSRALTHVVERHDALRSRFEERGGVPACVIDAPAPVPVTVHDLASVPPATRSEEVERVLAAETGRPFDLARGPLLRAALVRLRPDEHVLVLTVHHIVFDGGSATVLFRDLGHCYRALAGGVALALPPVPGRYADYAAEQRAALAGGGLDRRLAHWRRGLAGLEPLDLPVDRAQPVPLSTPGRGVPFEVPNAVVRGATALAKGHRTTPFVVLLAAFQTLLVRWTGRTDIAVAVPVADRARDDVLSLVGLFVDILVVRCDLSGDPSFGEAVRRVRGAVLDALGHQVPFGRLVEELRTGRDRGRHPLAQVLFGSRGAPDLRLDVPGVEAEVLPWSQGSGGFDVTVELEESEAVIAGSLHQAGAFAQATIASLARQYVTLLADVVADESLRLSEPALLSNEDQLRLSRWNDSASALHGPLVHEWLAERARSAPDTPAVVAGDVRLTHRELHDRARRLANHLRRRGAGAETRIGVCLERSAELVVALHGVLQAGAAYVPFDPALPADRLAFLHRDSGVALVVTQSRLLQWLPEAARPAAVCVDADRPTIAAEPAAAPAVEVHPGNLAYVMYTSGSTGEPKAAMNTHGAIRNRLLWMQSAYGLEPTDRVLHKTPFGFDVSLWELLWPALAGAVLVVAPPGAHLDPTHLVELIERERVTTAHFVPSMLRLFLEEPGVERLTGLRRLMCSGEALAPDLRDRCLATLPAELHNLYGPTEAAIDVTTWACARGDDRETVPIGRPVANTRMHLVDPLLRRVPPGAVGELGIAGIQLARGYLGRPGLTAERFVPDPFSPVPGGRMYLTGDRARHAPDGAIEFLGRLDDQVKLHGARIEPGEIEVALRAHPDVRDAALVVRAERLVACVVPADAVEPSLPGRLRRFLAGRLPEYMVPSAYLQMRELPKTPNGKLDRAGLAGLDSEPLETDTGYRVPATPTEEALAEIWAELLGRQRVGLDDDFFQLGGHSLLATQMVARVRKRLGVELPVTTAFETRTISSLASSIDRPGVTAAKPAVELRPVAREAYRVPVSELDD